ncbi:hypothetical protein HXX76_014338 [Chlamydomonas incerta]|uniref:FAD-binding domain-containing protein n=1 Tax=Chlamydomonas incerta TaxID=51695 RepID=A0A835SC95_CHLIN|nr:hypothetical protein HXX76_014338 [Chlamydomonas incerta]|eukprot:KAG2424613.1 hypothetical protein HXX76_014338 [Chlamydomonas incerta]
MSAPNLPAQVPSPTTSKPNSQRSQALPVETVDVAVIGADIAGLVSALAASKANPQARVTLFDTASEPPAENDGGVLLSVNGLRALKALDAGLYGRLMTELTSSVHESLFFDMEGQMVRRTPLGQPSSAAASGAAAGGAAGSGRSQRVSARRKAAVAAANAARAAAEPDPTSPPLLVGLHELREALLDALPPDVEIFGRHHLRDIEVGPSGGGSTLLRFALSPSPSAPAVRTVRAKLVIGADGPGSAVRNLQFDTVPAAEQPNSSSAAAADSTSATSSAAQQQQPSTQTAQPQQQPPARIVWRGRFTLRARDPDCARLRNFTTATRTWVDLRAAPGSERVAWLSPAGPNTFVWSASCPAQLLAGRGLPEAAPEGVAEWGKDSPYWRCVAMFEDFPQDFFSAMRATAAAAVVEAGAPRPAPPAATAAAAAALAAPWQWFSGAAALVGDAVYGRAGASLAVDDVASTALNLVLEDAAVLGTCVRQHGMTQRAMAEYGRMRASRVSGMLALPLTSPERVRLRDAVFLPQQQQTQQQTQAATAASDAPAAPLAAAAPAAAPAAVAPAVPAPAPAPAPPASVAAAAVAPIVANVAAVVAESSNGGTGGSPSAAPEPPMIDLSRPSGGASRTPPGSMDLPGLEPTAPGGAPSSPVFSRPSGGAGRVAPGATAAAAAAAAAFEVAADASALVIAASASTSGSAPVIAEPVPAYSVATTPAAVWEVLLGLRPTAASVGAGSSAAASSAVDTAAAGGDAEAAPVPYCSQGTPAAVWQALLLSPAAAHDTLASHPYDPSESPSLAWMALLGPRAPAAPSPQPARATPSPPGSPARPACASSSTAAARPVKAAAPAPAAPAPDMPLPRPVGTSFMPVAAAPAAPAVDPKTLLPKPVLKKPASASAAPSSAPAPPASPSAAAAPSGAPVGTSFTPAAESPAPAAVATPAEQQQPAAPVPAGSGRPRRSAAADGKARGATRRDRRPAPPVTPASSSVGSSGPAPRATRGQVRAVKAAAAAAGAAKAAVNMTVHLGAAAALGGAMASAAHGVPVDAMFHVTHGAVAQVAQVSAFWDELNNLTLASSSLSSMDVTGSVDLA